MEDPDKKEIIGCYLAMYDGEIRKDTEYLSGYLDEKYILIHMTGTVMNRQEYFDAILDGTLNYYRCIHENMAVSVNGDEAHLTGDTKVEAAVYGTAKQVWPLRLECEFRKKEGKWKMIRSKASMY